jgi:hypothetical protein
MESDDFKVTQVFKVKQGSTEIVFPLYNLDKHRNGELYTESVPDEMHQNIETNCKAVKDRLQYNRDISSEGIAIVGYGPTLQATWPDICDFKTIITTSGAHKFLVQHDVIPTYHVDIDYRERKAVYLNEPHSDVTYLLGSMVHPKMIENVGSNRIKLWHLDLDGLTYPPGEVVLPGYWDVGQQAILVAQVLGYKHMHLFGFDYSYDVNTDQTHAGEHGSLPDIKVMAKVGDKYFPTADHLVRGMLTFIKLMEDHPELTLMFHSNGLLVEYIKYHFTK